MLLKVFLNSKNRTHVIIPIGTTVIIILITVKAVAAEPVRILLVKSLAKNKVA